jgi:hypothetical protein
MKYGGMVSDAFTYAGNKIRAISPKIYEYGKYALSPVATAARAGGRMAMMPIRGAYTGAKLAAGMVPGGRLAMSAIKRPVKWAMRNPGDALLLGATAIGAAGFGAGLYDNPLGMYALLEKAPVVGTVIKTAAGAYKSAEEGAKAGEAIGKMGGHLWQGGRMAKHALGHMRQGEYVKMTGNLMRGMVHGGKLAAHGAGALFHTGKATGQVMQTIGTGLVKPAIQILSPVGRGMQQVYTKYGPTELVNKVLIEGGLRDAPEAIAAAEQAAQAAELANVEAAAVSMPYLDAAGRWAMSKAYQGGKAGLGYLTGYKFAGKKQTGSRRHKGRRSGLLGESRVRSAGEARIFRAIDNLEMK